jgi:hypothetical protein
MTDKSDFLNPRSRFHGEFTPENLVFDSNLQEFSHRVGIICALETGGKLTPEQAFEQIRSLWQQLELSKQQLGIGDET